MKLIRYGASWCQPCSALKMTLSGIEHPLVKTMEEIDIDSNVQAAISMNIRSVPVLVLLNEEGYELRRLNGAQSKEKIMEFLG
jgi:thioredoxin-like negative regulator of GroEL